MCVFLCLCVPPNPVARQRLGNKPSRDNKYTYNKRRTVGRRVIYAVRAVSGMSML
jgi:hypothetical protein